MGAVSLLYVRPRVTLYGAQRLVLATFAPQDIAVQSTGWLCPGAGSSDAWQGHLPRVLTKSCVWGSFRDILCHFSPEQTSPSVSTEPYIALYLNFILLLVKWRGEGKDSVSKCCFASFLPQWVKALLPELIVPPGTPAMLCNELCMAPHVLQAGQGFASVCWMGLCFYFLYVRFLYFWK